MGNGPRAAHGNRNAAARPAGPRTTLCDVAVVDTRTGRVTEHQNVTAIGNLIVAITSHDPTRIPEGIAVDLRGKYLIPGLNDMHAHPLGDGDRTATLKLMLATGVTGFRQMNGSLKLLKQRRTGCLPMPEASPAVLEMPGSVLTPLNAGNAMAARASVREQYAGGADFIKVGLVSPDVFFAVQAEAQRIGIPVLGHLPAGIDAVAASAGGMKSIEHLGPGLPIVAACSPKKTGLLAAATSPPKLPFRIPFADELFLPMMRKQILNPYVMAAGMTELLQRAIDTFSDDLAEELASDFKADGTWHVPTLIRECACKNCGSPQFQDDPNHRLVDPDVLDKWRDSAHRYHELPDRAQATYTESYDLELRLTKTFADAGVKLLAGSDSSGGAWEVPGYALHQEFDALAAAGLTPLQILQSTTLLPAQYLDRTATMGTVDVGKDADLVALDANPIDDVRHLHHVSAVMRAGRYYSSDELAAITDDIAVTRSIT